MKETIPVLDEYILDNRQFKTMKNVKIYDMAESIRASKFPMAIETDFLDFSLTPTQYTLAQCRNATGHDCYLKGIKVSMDLTVSNKMWVQLQRYHFIDIVSSCSMMHCATKFDYSKRFSPYVSGKVKEAIEEILMRYQAEPEGSPARKEIELELLYNMPSGFLNTARVTTNYLQLKTIYLQRHNHRLPEWKDFCKDISNFPYSELFMPKRAEKE